MNHENEVVHYRCRFTLSRPEGEDAMLYVQDKVYEWVCGKERRRRSERGRTLAAVLDGPDARALFRRGPIDKTTGYEGRERGPCLRVFGIPGDEGKSCVWAMDYNEPGSEPDDHDLDGWRRWHTRIGLVSHGGDDCDVVVNVGWYVLPEYVGVPLETPESNVPNIARLLLDDNAGRLSVGPTPLNLDYRDLDDTATNDFIESLLDENRELPIVLVTGNHNGILPVPKIDDVMDTVRGLANVYVLTSQTNFAWQKFQRLFERDKPSWYYRCEEKKVRIYFPGVDLSNRSGSSRHPYYTGRQIDELCGWRADGVHGFTDDLVWRLSYAASRFPRDVLDLEDVALLASRASSLSNRKRLHELREKLEESESRNDELQGQYDSLEELVELADEAFKDKERAEAKVEELTSKLESMDWRVRTAHQNAAEAKDAAAASDALREAFLDMEWIPEELTDLLDLAERAWPTRLAVCDEARTSAVDCGQYDLQEAWQILRGIALVLHPIVFEEQANDLEGEFQSRTGFDLAMSESRATQAQGDIMKSRRVTCDGVEYDITPHIKGRGRGKGKGAFRVHFAIDRENGRFVIGHFGEHMETCGTRKM